MHVTHTLNPALGGGYDALGSGSSNEGDISGAGNQVFIAFEGFLSQ